MPDFLIRPVGEQYTETEGLAVQFSCFGTDGTRFTFQVPYVYGATMTNKQNAIIKAAKEAYTAVTEQPVPAGARAEVIGIG